MNKSPERGQFHIDNVLKKVDENKIDTVTAEKEIEFFKSHRERVAEMEATIEWQTDNMEYDLRSTEWIIDKVKSDDIYAQHLYAAMCNNDFTKNAVWPLLTEKRWSCSWRHAGGIIADMQEKGDYIDWYCSGIRPEIDLDETDTADLSLDQRDVYMQAKAYVSESIVTEEIRTDLLKLGWIVIAPELDE